MTQYLKQMLANLNSNLKMNSQCFQVMRDFDENSQNQPSAIPQPKKQAIPKLNLHLYQDSRNDKDFQTISLTQREDLAGVFGTADSNQILGHSALQSNRTYNASTLEHTTPLLSNRINFESTSDLKTYVTIDLAKINRDRQNQLKLALEDNLREKESLANEIQSSFTQQRQDYERTSLAFDQRSRDLETEIARQKEHMSTLKRQTAQIDDEQQRNEREFYQKTDNLTTQITSTQDSIENLTKSKETLESELQIMKYEKQSLEQRIEVRYRVRMQELDVKVKPLADERDQILLNIQLMKNNQEVLAGIKEQNDNEKQMIEEDLMASNQTKIGLIYQREEIEQYIEQKKTDNPDVEFIIGQIHQNEDMLKSWGRLRGQLVEEKQRNLLLDLIREFHQYILGMSSNTTDNSVMQSDELEELQFMIEKNTVSTQEAVELVADFAQSKIKLSLNPELLQHKLDQIIEAIDEDSLKQTLQDLQYLEEQMKEIDCKIKIITNRCQNELLPRQKALKLSEYSMNEDLQRVTIGLLDLQTTLQILDGEIEELQQEFEKTQPVVLEDETENENLREKAQELGDQIDQIQEDILSISDQRKDHKERLNALNSELQKCQQQFEVQRDLYSARYNDVLEAIKREKTNILQFEFTTPSIQELMREVAQLKCDKESASKRLKYMEIKLQNAQESVMHSKQVLDNHMLQIQQEQLHQKINQTSGAFKQRRRTSIGNQENLTPIINQKKNQEVHNKPDFNKVQILDSQHLKKLSMDPNENGLKSMKSEVQFIKQYQNQSCQGQIKDYQGDKNRLHQQLIEPDDSSKSIIQFDGRVRTNQNDAIKSERFGCDSLSNNSKGLSQQHRDVIRAYLQKEKSVSAADLVKYNYESSAVLSSIEDMQSCNNPRTQNLASKSNTLSAINLVALAQSKNIPIQTLITPRENVQEMQYNHSHQASLVSQQTQYEIGYCGQFDHNQSIGSADSICHTIENKLSYENLQNLGQNINIQDSPSIQSRQPRLSHHTQSLFQPNTLPSVKISLRSSHNNSIDDARYMMSSSLGSSINFKENIAPNSGHFTSATLNLRRLSQAASLSTLQQSQSQQNKPPAVPQGKLLGPHHPPHHTNQNSQTYMIYADSISNSSRKRLSLPLTQIQKGTVNHENNQIGGAQRASYSQFNSNRQSIGNASQVIVQTKMRLCQNTNNGKILAVGIVDLSRCNQSIVQRDIHFFESIKPLIEGAQFMFYQKHGGAQCQAKHIYLDFSLLRLFITATSNSINADRREILMVENIIKTELPQVTLELIKSEKQVGGGGLADSQNSHHHGSVSSSSQSNGISQKRYEFHIIMTNSQTGFAERMQMLTKSYEELRLWIIGLNALIGNKKDLMRLSTMIKC